MDNQLKMLHAVLQEILDYIVEICEREGFTYFLAYGTALGAYRHHDFIPWDDDLDIVMPRDDYEKFIAYMTKHASDIYVIQNEDNEESYFLSFAKVRKRGTVFIESITTQTYKENGVYVDIFPLDYVDSPDSIKTKVTNLRITYWRHALKFTSCRQLYREKLGWVRFFLESVICIPVDIVGTRKAVKKLQRIMQQNGSASSQFVAQYDQVLDKAILSKDIYFPPCKMEFSTKLYCVPNDIEGYLCSQYGEDYMELPPVEKRQTHKPVQLKL